IAGLTIAHRLRQHGRQVVCLEAAPVAGGAIRTQRQGCHLWESGPQNVLEVQGGPVGRLAAELGIDTDMVGADNPAMFLYRAGKLVALPRGLPGLLSVSGVARALAEAVIPRGSEPDETVDAWARRRFGSRVADLLLAPTAAAISLGDPARLSARS